MTAAAVLAGRASRRMGRDKATLAVGGGALPPGVLAAAAGVADPVFLVAPAAHPARGLAARVVTDPGEGPLAALAAALAALEADHVLVLAGDHPGLAGELLAHLAALAPGGEAVACRRGPRLEPLVAVYRRGPAGRARPPVAPSSGSWPTWTPWSGRSRPGVPSTPPAAPSSTSTTPPTWPPGKAGRARVLPDPIATGGAVMDQTNQLEAFLERVRSLLGPTPPTVGDGEVEAILELARVAAHSSERRAAPVTTYLAGLVLGGA